MQLGQVERWSIDYRSGDLLGELSSEVGEAPEELSAAGLNLRDAVAAHEDGVTGLLRVVLTVWCKTQQQLYHPLHHTRVNGRHLQDNVL